MYERGDFRIVTEEGFVLSGSADLIETTYNEFFDLETRDARWEVRLSGRGQLMMEFMQPRDIILDLGIEGTCSVCGKKFSSTARSYGGKVVLSVCPSCYNYGKRMT